MSPTLFLLLCLALPAQAEIFKCGNRYQDTPCPEGVTLQLPPDTPAYQLEAAAAEREEHQARAAQYAEERRQREEFEAPFRQSQAIAERTANILAEQSRIQRAQLEQARRQTILQLNHQPRDRIPAYGPIYFGPDGGP